MSASLSSLPRAALSAKEGYWWINTIALALSAVVASMSWTAYDMAGQPERAAVCIVAQALAIALAILGRRAFTGQMPLSGLAALLLAAGCAWWASHGLALAWYADADRNSEPMVIFMAGLEPALFLLAEHIREGRETLRAAHEKAERELAEELAAIRNRPPARAPFQPSVVDGGKIGQAAATAGALAAVATGQAQAQPAGLPPLQPSQIEAVSHSAHVWASPTAHAEHLLKSGVSQREVSRQTGLTRYRVGQIAGSVAA